MLSITNLTVSSDSDTSEHAPGAIVRAVSLDVRPQRCLALVGESGSGKSLTALSILGLLPHPFRVTAGEVRLANRNLRTLSPHELRRVRARDIGMIFQEPMTSLNPVLRIEQQVTEVLPSHLSHAARRSRAAQLLGQAGIPDPLALLRKYPHELSGGLRQRVLLAIAIANDPKLLIADEPTTALDVTVQAQILAHLKSLMHEHNLALLLISHDLALLERFADDVAVMYAGRIVERAPAAQLFQAPAHPYTRALLASTPRLDSPNRTTGPLPVIAGEPPVVGALPAGCAFHPRCTTRNDDVRCATAIPSNTEIGPGHIAACWHARPAEP